MFHTNPKSAASAKRAAIRKALREKYRSRHGDNWFANPRIKAAYEKEARAKQVLPADMFEHLGVKPSGSRKSSKGRKGSKAGARQRDAKGRFMNPFRGLAVSSYGEFDDFDLL
jgi:hypothetical protein